MAKTLAEELTDTNAALVTVKADLVKANADLKAAQDLLAESQKLVTDANARIASKDSEINGLRIQFDEYKSNSVTKADHEKRVSEEALKMSIKAVGSAAIPPLPSSPGESKIDLPKSKNYDALVAEQVAAGKTRGEAITFVVKNHPQAYEAWRQSIGVRQKD